MESLRDYERYMDVFGFPEILPAEGPETPKPCHCPLPTCSGSGRGHSRECLGTMVPRRVQRGYAVWETANQIDGTPRQSTPKRAGPRYARKTCERSTCLFREKHVAQVRGVAEPKKCNPHGFDTQKSTLSRACGPPPGLITREAQRQVLYSWETSKNPNF